MRIPEGCPAGPIHSVHLKDGEPTRTTCVYPDDPDGLGVGPVAIGPAIHIQAAMENGWGAALLVARECRENEHQPGLIFQHDVVDARAPSEQILYRAFAEAWVVLHSRLGVLVSCGSGLTRAPVFAAGILRFLGVHESFDDAYDYIRSVHSRVAVRKALTLSVKKFVERLITEGAKQGLEPRQCAPHPFSRLVPGHNKRPQKAVAKKKRRRKKKVSR